MPAHLRMALTSVSLLIPVASSQLMLGTWQDIYLFKHCRDPHRLNVVLHLIGE